MNEREHGQKQKDLLEKKKFPQKQKVGTELAIENNPCSMCRVRLLPICTGHGSGSSGGGGGGGGSGSGGETKQTATLSSNQLPFVPDLFADMKTGLFWAPLLNSNTAIKFEVGLLSVECDPKNGILVIGCKPGLSDTDQKIVREYLNELKNSFERFKKDNKYVSGEVSDNGYSVTFKIPDQTHFKAFILHLEKENLLPTPPIKQEKKRKYESVGEDNFSSSLKNDETTSKAKDGKNQKRFHPTPLPTDLTKK